MTSVNRSSALMAADGALTWGRLRICISNPVAGLSASAPFSDGGIVKERYST